MGKIFFVTGKSCSGKDTIFDKLIKNKELHLEKIVGYTTRPMRDNETQGIEYNFVDEAELSRLRADGVVIEERAYNTVYGVWHYFTVDDSSVNLDMHDYLYIGTLESYKKMAAYYGCDKVVPIYIEVETGERLMRALKREMKQDNPKYKEMCRRFITDEEDFSEERIADAGIQKRYINDDFDKCLDEIDKNIYKIKGNADGRI